MYPKNTYPKCLTIFDIEGWHGWHLKCHRDQLLIDVLLVAWDSDVRRGVGDIADARGLRYCPEVRGQAC